MSEISSRTVESLHQDLIEKREALRTFRFGGAGSRSRNVREGRGLRKDIARILTEINARNLPARGKIASSKKTA